MLHSAPGCIAPVDVCVPRYITPTAMARKVRLQLSLQTGQLHLREHCSPAPGQEPTSTAGAKVEVCMSSLHLKVTKELPKKKKKKSCDGSRSAKLGKLKCFFQSTSTQKPPPMCASLFLHTRSPCSSLQSWFLWAASVLQEWQNKLLTETSFQIL